MWELGANRWITLDLSIVAWHLKDCSLFFKLNRGEETQDSASASCALHIECLLKSPSPVWKLSVIPVWLVRMLRLRELQQQFHLSLSRPSLASYHPCLSQLPSPRLWINRVFAQRHSGWGQGVGPTIHPITWYQPNNRSIRVLLAELTSSQLHPWTRRGSAYCWSASVVSTLWSFHLSIHSCLDSHVQHLTCPATDPLNVSTLCVGYHWCLHRTPHVVCQKITPISISVC